MSSSAEPGGVFVPVDLVSRAESLDGEAKPRLI